MHCIHFNTFTVAAKCVYCSPSCICHVHALGSYEVCSTHTDKSRGPAVRSVRNREFDSSVGYFRCQMLSFDANDNEILI